jgi:hypothetical protein
MKTNLAVGILLLVLTLPLLSYSQPQGRFDYDKFKAEKVAYLTDAINLTPKEAEVFWPVYNEFEKKKWELSTERRELDESLKSGIKEMSNKEYIELSRRIVKLHADDSKLTEEYNEKFIKILPPKKVLMLYLAELNFRDHLLRKYRGGDQRERGNLPGPNR